MQFLLDRFTRLILDVGSADPVCSSGGLIPQRLGRDKPAATQRPDLDSALRIC
jgi:hypothetical protein